MWEKVIEEGPGGAPVPATTSPKPPAPLAEECTLDVPIELDIIKDPLSGMCWDVYLDGVLQTSAVAANRANGTVHRYTSPSDNRIEMVKGKVEFKKQQKSSEIGTKIDTVG